MSSQTLAPDGPREPAIGPRGIARALTAATLLLLVIIAGAALGGDWAMDPRTPTLTISPPPETVPPAEQQETSQPTDGGSGLSIQIALRGVAGAAAALLAYLLIRWIHRTLVPWLRARVGPVPEPPSRPMLQVPLAALAEATAHAETLLVDSTPPTDAIIAAWLALEDAAVRSGATRQPAQTPTEFTLAVLSATPASPQAVTDLLALYHLARFAHTDMTADQVIAARSALRQLTDDFRRRTPRVDEAGAEAEAEADAEEGVR